MLLKRQIPQGLSLHLRLWQPGVHIVATAGELIVTEIGARLPIDTLLKSAEPVSFDMLLQLAPCGKSYLVLNSKDLNAMSLHNAEIVQWQWVYLLGWTWNIELSMMYALWTYSRTRQRNGR